MEKKRHRIGSKVILGITALFFYLPIIYIIVCFVIFVFTYVS